MLFELVSGRATRTRRLSLASAGVALLAALSFTPDARADDEGGEPEAQAEVEITDKARSHFKAGVNLLQDPDGARYEEAYDQFRAAYAESPSWKILGNLGVTAMKLEKDGEAIDAFEKYLTEGGDEIGEEERAQFTRDRDTLRASVVTVTLSSIPGGVKIIDERIGNRGGSIRNQYVIPESGQLQIKIRPGTHKMTARMSGYENAIWEVDARAASVHEYSFTMQRPAAQNAAPASATSGPPDSGTATHRPVPLSVWIGAGATVAFAGAGAAMGIIALGKNNEHDDANAELDPEADDFRNEVKQFNLLADAFFGGAIVAGAVTTVLFVTRPEVKDQSAVKFRPVVGPNVAALALSGRF